MDALQVSWTVPSFFFLITDKMQWTKCLQVLTLSQLRKQIWVQPYQSQIHLVLPVVFDTIMPVQKPMMAG